MRFASVWPANEERIAETLGRIGKTPLLGIASGAPDQAQHPSLSLPQQSRLLLPDRLNGAAHFCLGSVRARPHNFIAGGYENDSNKVLAGFPPTKRYFERSIARGYWRNAIKVLADFFSRTDSVCR